MENIQSLIPIAVFLVTSVSVAIITHKNLIFNTKLHFISLSIISGFITSMIFQIIGFMVLGYIDPFFIIAFIVGVLLATFIALLVGLMIKAINNSKPKTEQ